MLYRRTKSKYWWTRFTAPGVGKVRESTGTEDRKAAEEYEAALKLRLWRQARMQEKPKRTWEEAVVRWIEETSHKATHEDDLTNLRWLDPHLKGHLLERIDRDCIDALKVARQQGGVTNATVNRTLALLRALLRRAEREWGWLEQAPAVRLLPEPKRRVRWLTQAQAQRLVEELPEHLAEMARFSLATGLREANVTGLQWDQVDLVRKVAWVHPDEAKAGHGIGVPLNEDAVAVLRRCQGRHPLRVFCYYKSGCWHPIRKAGGAAWRKALARAGITDFRWHDLRHTWASWHAQAGTPQHALQELGGWSSAAMVRRYAHLAPEHLAGYAAALPSAGTPNGTAATTPHRPTALVGGGDGGSGEGTLLVTPDRT